MFRKLSTSMALLFVVTGAGCVGSAPTGDTANPTPAPVPVDTSGGGTGGSDPLGPGGGSNTSGNESNTFDHENDAPDPFEVLSRYQEQGPPEVAARLHSCQKVRYETLGTLLRQLGVDLQRNAPNGQPRTAGQLYRGGAGALGAPNYQARISEAIELTTSGATKLFDVFVQAAPEIIAAMPNNDHCKKAGAAVSMFDDNGKCTLDGISCLTGVAATQAQKDLCDQVLTEASSPQIGQAIAVASILAAAHTCE